MALPWPVEERGGFEPIFTERGIFTEPVNIVPPWGISKRINPDESFQKEEQGHGWHGYFEGGGEGGGPSPADAAADQAPQVDLTDTSWATSGQPMTADSFAQMLAQQQAATRMTRRTLASLLIRTPGRLLLLGSRLPV